MDIPPGSSDDLCSSSSPQKALCHLEAELTASRAELPRVSDRTRRMSQYWWFGVSLKLGTQLCLYAGHGHEIGTLALASDRERV